MATCSAIADVQGRATYLFTRAQHFGHDHTDDPDGSKASKLGDAVSHERG